MVPSDSTACASLLVLQEPNSRYRYQIAGASVVYEFTSAAAPSADHSFTFLAFGDMGDSDYAATKSPG